MNLLGRRLLTVVPALLLVASCGSESPPPKATPSPTVGASHRGDIDVLGAVLVMNDDGSATLSARIVNNTSQTRVLGAVTPGDPDADNAYLVHFAGDPLPGAIKPGAAITLGRAEDFIRVRVSRSVDPGLVIPLRFRFDLIDNFDEAPTVALDVPVVARSSAYDAIVGNKPNTAITVENARITVLPGQSKAYVDGTVISTIDDGAYTPPTAVNAKGRPVKYEHQTATGGPYGLFASKDKSTEIGSGPPYKEREGDADYFNAEDVTVGETITVLIPFESGDVIVPFKVVAG